MKFNLIEKLALLKAIDEVIRIDDKITKGEVRFFDELSDALDFKPTLVLDAREVEPEESIAVLKNMPRDKQLTMVRLLNEAANADGNVDEKEIQFIYKILRAADVDI